MDFSGGWGNISVLYLFMIMTTRGYDSPKLRVKVNEISQRTASLCTSVRSMML